MCALTTSLNEIFKRNGDESKEITLAIPANIRFQFYPTREKVVLENKFAAIPLTVPLTETMESSYEKIKKVTKALKGSFGLIYGVYAVTFWTVKLLPRWICSQYVEECTQKFSVGFSNTPGPIKSFIYKHPDRESKIKTVSSQSYIMVGGRLGVALCAISQAGYLRLTLCSDQQLIDESLNSELLQSIFSKIM